MPVFDKILFWQKKFCIYTEKFPKIYNSFSKIDKISSKINKNLPKINRICQKLTKIRQNQRKFVENFLKFGTKIWYCHPSSPKNFPVLCRFFKISSSKKRHKSGTRLYIDYKIKIPLIVWLIISLSKLIIFMRYQDKGFISFVRKSSLLLANTSWPYYSQRVGTRLFQISYLAFK